MAEETKPKIETQNPENKTEEKKEKKVKGKKDKITDKKPKTETIAYGRDLGISTKHSIAICNLIRNRQIDNAMLLLTEVVKMKRAVPMKGEIPHRKGMERGRYPVNASKQFIKLLKQLAANASVSEIDLEKARIGCKADRANRPYKRFGQTRFKRTNVLLKLKYPELKNGREKIC